MTGLAFTVGVLFGATVGFIVAGLLLAARRADDFAALHDRERQSARLRVVLGHDDTDGGAA